MANEAEVDIVVNAAGALPDLERQLARILREAENDADAIDVPVAIDTRDAVRTLSAQLGVAVNAAEGQLDGIEVGVLIDQRDALRTLDRQLTRLVDDANRGITSSDPVTIQAVLDSPESIRTMRTQLERVVASVQATAPDVEVEVEIDQNVDNDVSRLQVGLDKLGRSALTSAQSAGSLARTVGVLGVAVGSALPTVASLVAALQQIAPAAAVGTQAMLAQKLVAGTLKLAMIDVEDAIKNAFDPEVKPEDFQKSLEQLAPEARKFVSALRDQRSELRALQQGVQNRVFRDFDSIFSNLGRRVLPIARSALNDTANSLNRMARNTADAAVQLSEQGVFGQALKGATQGLQNLERVPARVAGSFGFLAAASAPAFNRITLAIDELSLKVSTKLAEAFESGALERAIDNSITAIGQLFTILGNFGAGVGNIFSGLTQDGGGLFDTLEKISEAFERLTASREFQAILAELALTADVLFDALLPLIEEAFKQLGPVIEILAPLVRDFVQAIGPELIPLVQQLGPILVDIALLMKEQLPLAIGLTRGAIMVLSAALTVVKFILEEAVLPAARAVQRFFEGDFARSIGALAQFFKIGFDAIKRLFGDFEGSSADTVNFVSAGLRRLGSAFRDGLVSVVMGALRSIQDSFVNLGNRILGVLSSLVASARGLGFDIINGLAAGLQGAAGRVLDIARGIANSVTSTIRDALDIRSPSRVMAKIGQDTVAGFALGMQNELPSVRKAGLAVAGLATATIANPQFPVARLGNAGLPTATISNPMFQRERIINVYIGTQLVEQIIDDRVRATMKKDVRVRSQGVRI